MGLDVISEQIPDAISIEPMIPPDDLPPAWKNKKKRVYPTRFLAHGAKPETAAVG